MLEDQVVRFLWRLRCFCWKLRKRPLWILERRRRMQRTETSSTCSSCLPWMEHLGQLCKGLNLMSSTSAMKVVGFTFTLEFVCLEDLISFGSLKLSSCSCSCLFFKVIVMSKHLKLWREFSSILGTALMSFSRIQSSMFILIISYIYVMSIVFLKFSDHQILILEISVFLRLLAKHKGTFSHLENKKVINNSS